MEILQDLLSHHRMELLVPLAVLVVTAAAGYSAKRIIFAALHRHAARTKTDFDDLVVQALHGPFMIWVLILGFTWPCKRRRCRSGRPLW